MSTKAFGKRLQDLMKRRALQERCELCNSFVGSGHPHLLEPVARKLLGVCQACAMLFSGRGETKFKRVPRRIRRLPKFQLTERQWDGLAMPINIGCFFKSTPQGKVVALYPSPTGVIESFLNCDTWDEIVRANPELEDMDADVEALLVNRIGDAHGFDEPEYYIVPIDKCLALVSLIRNRWQGLSGGDEVWQDVGGFFAGLKSKTPGASKNEVGETISA